MTADHLHPRVLGGQDCPANIVAACFECNVKRSYHLSNPTVARAEREKLGVAL